MPDPFTIALDRVVTDLREALADDLMAIVLFGSAAEGRRRTVSDTNLAVVVRRLDPARAVACREVVSLARVALRLRLMLLRADELPAAAEAFAVKFADIQRRRKVLHGEDPFAGLSVPRAAAIAQLRQALMNLVLRLRAQWLGSRDDQQLVLAAAHDAGGLRACAAELLTLEGTPVANAREALERINGGPMPDLSQAREGRLAPGVGDRLLAQLMALAETMRERAAGLQ